MTGFGVILGNYIRRALVYRWIVLVPTVFVFALVTLNVTIQPDTYESHAVLMPPLAKPGEGATREDTAQIGGEIFRTATERLLSTTTLMKVAEKVDPYPDLRKSQGIAAVVEKLRESIRIEVNHKTGAITVYSAQKRGDRPAERAAAVVNALTSFFVETQLEALDEKAAKYEKFLLQEKVRLRRDLERAQKRVDEFRQANVGQLPDDVERNQQTVMAMRQQIVDYRQNQRMMQGQVRTIQRDQARLDTEIALATERGTEGAGTALRAAQQVLTNLEFELRTLSLTYDESSDKIQNQKILIEQIKGQIESLKTDEKTDVAKMQERYLKFLQDENRKQIKRYEDEVDIIDGVVRDLESKIEGAQNRILTAAKLTNQWESLQRDVDEITERYEGIQGQLAGAIHRRNYHEYDAAAPIQVEQSAFVPAAPVGPDRLFTSLIGLIIGLGIGVGLAVARAKLDASYQQADDLRALMPGAVLVTIPEVRTSTVRVGRAIVGIIGGLILTGVFAATVAILGVQAGWWGEPEMIQPLLNLR